MRNSTKMSWIEKLSKIKIYNVELTASIENIKNAIANSSNVQSIFKDTDFTIEKSSGGGNILLINSVPFFEFRSNIRMNNYAKSFGKTHPDIEIGSDLYKSLVSDMVQTAVLLPDTRVNRTLESIEKERGATIGNDKHIDTEAKFINEIMTNNKANMKFNMFMDRIREDGFVKGLGYTVDIAAVVTASTNTLVSYIAKRIDEETGVFAYRYKDSTTKRLQRYKIKNCSCQTPNDAVNDRELSASDQAIFKNLLGADYFNITKLFLDCNFLNSLCIHAQVPKLNEYSNLNNIYTETMSHDLIIKCRNPDLWDLFEEMFQETIGDIKDTSDAVADNSNYLFDKFYWIIIIVIVAISIDVIGIILVKNDTSLPHLRNEPGALQKNSDLEYI